VDLRHKKGADNISRGGEAENDLPGRYARASSRTKRARCKFLNLPPIHASWKRKLQLSTREAAVIVRHSRLRDQPRFETRKRCFRAIVTKYGRIDRALLSEHFAWEANSRRK
jgi:hypothetical protein